MQLHKCNMSFALPAPRQFFDHSLRGCDSQDGIFSGKERLDLASEPELIFVWNMFALVIADGRLLGFDFRDWSMLLGGIAAIGCLLILLL